MIQSKSEKSGRKVSYYALGCKLNFAEMSHIGRQLSSAGYMKASNGEQADVCIINTCAVTEVAERKSRQMIRQIARQNPTAEIIVTGCYAQLNPDILASIPEVSLVLGVQERFDILAYLSQKQAIKIHRTKTSEIRDFYPALSGGDRTRLFLKIQDGCDYFCSYCTIPLARGQSRSSSVEETIKFVRMASSKRAKEIVLTGVNIGTFGKTTGETFLDLLKALEKIEEIKRYRISSIEPNLLSEKIISFIASSSRFAPHFHIPLQSGNDEILTLMRRRYTRYLFLQKIRLIRDLMPNAFIGVDVITGTRGESDNRFWDGYKFISDLPISALHVFPYSERQGTSALKLQGKVEKDIQKERVATLMKLSKNFTERFYQSHDGYMGTVLWESVHKAKSLMSGFTENYIKVYTEYNEAFVNKTQVVRLHSPRYDHGEWCFYTK